ncbi:hypothetical protein DAPPUDRAFT_123292, partial [Daphnia pulex]
PSGIRAAGQAPGCGGQSARGPGGDADRPGTGHHRGAVPHAAHDQPHREPERLGGALQPQRQALGRRADGAALGGQRAQRRGHANAQAAWLRPDAHPPQGPGWPSPRKRQRRRLEGRVACPPRSRHRSLSLDRPARASTRLTVEADTPTLRSMRDWIIWRRRSSTISSALAGSMARGDRTGRDDASARPATPPSLQPSPDKHRTQSIEDSQLIHARRHHRVVVDHHRHWLAAVDRVKHQRGSVDDDQGRDDLQHDERHAAGVDLPGADAPAAASVGRHRVALGRDAAQVRQRQSERWGQERGLQGHRDDDAEPDQVDLHGHRHRRQDRDHDERDLESVDEHAEHEDQRADRQQEADLPARQ